MIIGVAHQENVAGTYVEKAIVDVINAGARGDAGNLQFMVTMGAVVAADRSGCDNPWISASGRRDRESTDCPAGSFGHPLPHLLWKRNRSIPVFSIINPEKKSMKSGRKSENERNRAETGSSVRFCLVKPVKIWYTEKNRIVMIGIF